MSSKDSPGHKSPATTDRRIEGPIAELNEYDRYTGVKYFRCTCCGAEALRRKHLQGCCER